MRFTKSTILAIFAASTEAYSPTGRTFAVNHFYGKGALTEGRMDPIVNPGIASSHVHTIQGGNAFALTMTDTQALDQSTCTSSLVKNDKSNYWVPKLYFQAEDGTLQDVELFYMNVYYFFEATTDKITAFQPGHRMVIGNPTLRTPPASGGKSILDLADGTPQPVQWTCPRSNSNTPLYPTNSDGLHGVGIQDPGNGGSGVGFSDKYCDGYASPLRADIHFPSCYDPSQGLDAFHTNMQFPTHGNCPEGWIHTPHLFYEVYWNTPLFSDQWTQGQGKQPFVLANGDPTGYSLHADFISGWDVDTLQQIIDNCDAGDAGMDKCPGLMGGLNDPSTSCNINSAIDETIVGPLAKLPGNNPIGQWGVNVAAPPPASAAAPVASSKPATSAAAPVVSTKPISSVADVVSTPATSAAGGNTPEPTTSAVGETKSTSTAGGVFHETSPAQSSPTSPAESNGADPAGPTEAPTTAVPTTPVAVGGAPNTLVTSYVSETTLILTTVTATGPAPSATGGSSTGGSTVAAGWSYYGCYSDTRTGTRVLSGITFANIGNHAVTNTKCVAYCDAKGYTLAGSEYGGQCFCDNHLTGSSAVDESKCDMPCEGDGSQTCGGSLTLSVYSKAGGYKRMSRHLHQHLRAGSK